MISKHNLLWLDLEMTGLNPEEHHILQIAAVITDQNLMPCSEVLDLVVHQSAENLGVMSPVVHDMHISSGLLNRVHSSSLSVACAEQEMIAFFNQCCIPSSTLLCGNSIWVDRIFLKRYMPTFERLFHYRMIDVSTIKELVACWYPAAQQFKKTKKHTARSDVGESIAELRYYREHYFSNAI